MKTKTLRRRLTSLSFGFTCVVLAAVFHPSSFFAQAPGLLWTTNIGATLFAVDAETNVYANVEGTVIKLNGDGVPLQTNSICPRPGIAIRDSAGNYYFAGLLPSHSPDGVNQVFDPQDFGGVVLSNMPVYLAKYTSAGTLVWATNVGPTSVKNNSLVCDDFAKGDEGDLVVSFRYSLGSASHFQTTAKFDSNGAQGWTSTSISSTYPGTVRLTPFSSTNFYRLTYLTSPSHAVLDRFDVTGAGTGIANWSSGFPFIFTPVLPRVILNSAGDLYNVEGNPNVSLTKRNPAGTVRWSVNTGTAQRAVGPDQYDGVHLASDTGDLSRYDIDGNLAWARSLPATCVSLLLDSSNNRFLSLAGGIVGRLGSETLASPVITNSPVGKKVFTGTNVVLTVGALGTTPLRYYWIKDSGFLGGATNATLTLSNPSFTQSGQYSVIVSNHAGSVTSAPVQVVIKAVELFHGSQMLTDGTYNFVTPPTLSVLSAFTNGSIFYTLDGSAPTFASTFYTNPFTIQSSATVRALGYSADFSQSEEADPVNIVLPPAYTLSASSTVGGYVTFNPPGGVYQSNSVVTVTANPTNGWSFLYWLGDASGTDASANVTMNVNKSVHAVFGTTLATTVAGNGQVLVYPAGGIYPHGTTVRLTGVPQPGNYFGVWGNAASGNSNPLYFTVTSPSPTVSSLFAATPAGQAALSVVITGRGQVTVDPRANAYATNQSVTLTATPDAGETFLGWSGDASGLVNPLLVNMDQDRVVVANFTGPFRLRADRPGLEGLLPEGFRLTVVGDPFAVYQIYGSTNLSDWTPLGAVSNTFSETQFTDPSATNAPTKFYKATQ